jgi:hypothetical protein
MFAIRGLMVIVVLAGSIHIGVADEASDAVQVLSRLWAGEKDGNARQFVGDSQTFKMRAVFHSSDGTVEVTTFEAPFRYFQEDPRPSWGIVGVRVSEPAVGVQCIFERECIISTGVRYDPVYRNPKLEGKFTYPREAHQYGPVKPSDAETVRQALRTLIRLNAAPPFDPSPR